MTVLLSTYSASVFVHRMFKHLDSQQTDQVKDAMFLVEHEPDDVVIREGVSQCGVKCVDFKDVSQAVLRRAMQATVV